MTLGLMPPMRETLRKRRPDEEISPIAEHGIGVGSVLVSLAQLAGAQQRCELD